MKTMKLVGKDWVFQQFVLWQSQLLRIRRDFHEHPELGFQTHRTAKRIAMTQRSFRSSKIRNSLWS